MAFESTLGWGKPLFANFKKKTRNGKAEALGTIFLHRLWHASLADKRTLKRFLVKVFQFHFSNLEKFIRIRNGKGENDTIWPTVPLVTAEREVEKNKIFHPQKISSKKNDILHQSITSGKNNVMLFNSKQGLLLRTKGDERE